MILCRFALIAVAALAAAPPPAAFTAKVAGVADGDTLTVLRGKTPIRIRLHGINAPETGQDFGSRAKQTASSLAFGQVVTVRPTDTDRYGRTVAVVKLPDGRDSEPGDGSPRVRVAIPLVCAG